MVWQQNKAYFLVYFTEVLVFAPLGFLNGTFLLYRIVDAVEAQRSIERILTFILVIAAIDIGLSIISNSSLTSVWRSSRCWAPRHTPSSAP